MRFNDKPIAVVSCLPPEKSGIAVFTKTTLGNSALPLEFFASGCNTTLDAGDKKVFPIGILRQRHEEVGYGGAIYVVGNSIQNLAAISCGLDSPIKRFVVCLHDPCLNDVVWQLINANPSIFNKANLRYQYAKIRGWKNFRRRPINGLRFWCSQMKRAPEGWIVHSHKAAEFVREVVQPNVPIFELFHPIFEIKHPCAAPKVKRPAKIGHFGMVDGGKRIEDLINVCRRIHQTVEPIRLIFAGYNADAVTSYLGPDDDFVTLHKSPSPLELLALMRSVDLAVQLREGDRGEASGVIAQLLGQRCHVLASDSSIVEQYGGLIHTVPTNADNEALFKTIITLLDHPSDQIHEAALEKFSLGNYQLEFKNILHELGLLKRKCHNK